MDGQKMGATAEHEPLDALVGEWTTRGRILAKGAEEGAPIAGTDTYEWLPGGYFLLHRVDVQMGSERVRTLEVIGYDPESRTFPTRYYDHRGNTGTYTAWVKDGVWIFETDGARATLRIHAVRDRGRGGRVRRMTALWEHREGDSGWQPWMELEFSGGGERSP